MKYEREGAMGSLENIETKPYQIPYESLLPNEYDNLLGFCLRQRQPCRLGVHPNGAAIYGHGRGRGVRGGADRQVQGTFGRAGAVDHLEPQII